MPLNPRNYERNGDGSAVDDPYSSSSFQDDNSNYNYARLQWPYVEVAGQRKIESIFFEKGATIHFEKLRGLPSWTLLYDRSDRTRVASILYNVVSTAQAAQRQLTAAEIDALSEHADASARKLVWVAPMTIVSSAAFIFKGMKTYKFPFYQPKMEKFNPFYFPTASKPLIKGAPASIAWHCVRSMVYVPLLWSASFVFMTSIASTSFQAHILRDSRLGNVMAAIQSNAKAHVSQNQQMRAGSKPVPRTFQPPRDDAPQGYGAGGSTDVSGSASDKYSGATGTWGASPSRQSQWGPPAAQTAAQTQSPKDPSWDSDPFEDDASPIAPSVRRAEAEQQQQQQQRSNGGSAWARLRQQSQSQTDSSNFSRGDSSGQERGWGRLRQDAAPNTKEGSRGTESFAYSRQDEEREGKNYEKEQAQKEFDALLESERRGETSNRRR